MFCRGCGSLRIPLIAACPFCGYRTRARLSLETASIRRVRLASLFWGGAAIAGCFMTSNVLWPVPADPTLRLVEFAAVVSPPIFIVGFSGFIALRLWRNPTRWLVLLGLLVVGLTLTYAVMEAAIAQGEDVATTNGWAPSSITLQPIVGVVAIGLAFIVTVLIRALLPGARCPHCATPLPLRAWRSCPRCGIVLSSTRYLR